MKHSTDKPFVVCTRCGAKQYDYHEEGFKWTYYWEGKPTGDDVTIPWDEFVVSKDCKKAQKRIASWKMRKWMEQ